MRRRIFFKEMEGKSEKAGTDIFSEEMLQKKESKGEKKVVEMRRH